MKIKTPARGEVVQSIQGRDAGHLYVVAEVLEKGYILAVDGKTRTLASPKRKNVKHVRLMPLEISGGLDPQDRASDNRVAYFLKGLKERADKR